MIESLVAVLTKHVAVVEYVREVASDSVREIEDDTLVFALSCKSDVIIQISIVINSKD